MAIETFTLRRAWDVVNCIVADGDTDINLANPSPYFRLTWTTTTSADLPGVDPDLANPVLPSHDRPMRLLDGEHLWLAGAEGAPAAVER